MTDAGTVQKGGSFGPESRASAPQKPELYQSVRKLFSVSPTVDLYHYTTPAGLLGILRPNGDPRSRRMWATDLRFVNDSREMKTGWDAILKELRPRVDKLYSFGTPGPFYRARIHSAISGGSFDYPSRTYTISFSGAEEDDLSQWRAYGANGGYAIRFPSGTANTLLRIKEARGWELGQVWYEPDKHAELAREFADEVIERLSALSDPQPELYALRAAMDNLASLMKDKAFRSEKEWRLVSPPVEPASFRDRVKFRTTRLGLTPYVELDLDVDDRVHGEIGIVVGPSPHPELAREAAIEFLLGNQFQVAYVSQRVSSSTIPWRPGTAS